jgi:hypothetical protein
VCSPRYLGRNMACRHLVLGANLTGFLEVARGSRTKLLSPHLQHLAGLFAVSPFDLVRLGDITVQAAFAVE